MTLPVFLADAGSLAEVAPGAVYELVGPEGRHAAVVRRVRSGERIDVVDGSGTRLRGTVRLVAQDAVSIGVEERTDEPATDVTLVLVQALAKGGRDELAIEAATEVGVDVVRPWQAERSVSVWAGSREERGARRWAAVVSAAAKQARRARVPAVAPLVRGRELTAVVEAAASTGSLAVVLHESAAVPLGAAPLPSRGEVLVVVGPEGGLSEGEVTALEAAGGVVARLGPHVLRTSTAGPVALALLAARLGRWGEAPGQVPPSGGVPTAGGAGR